MDQEKLDLIAVDHNLTPFGKIHGHPTVDIGLYLPGTPARFGWMANKYTGGQMRRETGHKARAATSEEETIMNDIELNSLVGSRICHDLISPLGAIGNGVELLSMAGMGAAPEITLISESVESANARIRFFRIAFGATANEALLGSKELRSVLSDLYRGNRLTIDWRVQEDVPRGQAKLAFLVLQCLESALPWGGNVLVTRTDQVWNVFGKASRLKIDQPLWEMIANPQDNTEVNAASVHFALVNPTAMQTGRRVTTNISDTTVSVSF